MTNTTKKACDEMKQERTKMMQIIVKFGTIRDNLGGNVPKEFDEAYKQINDACRSLGKAVDIVTGYVYDDSVFEDHVMSFIKTFSDD